MRAIRGGEDVEQVTDRSAADVVALWRVALGRVRRLRSVDGRAIHQELQVAAWGVHDLRDAEEATVTEFGGWLKDEGRQHQDEGGRDGEEPGATTDEEQKATNEEPSDARLGRERMGRDKGADE